MTWGREKHSEAVTADRLTHSLEKAGLLQLPLTGKRGPGSWVSGTNKVLGKCLSATTGFHNICCSLLNHSVGDRQGQEGQPGVQTVRFDNNRSAGSLPTAEAHVEKMVKQQETKTHPTSPPLRVCWTLWPVTNSREYPRQNHQSPHQLPVSHPLTSEQLEVPTWLRESFCL